MYVLLYYLMFVNPKSRTIGGVNITVLIVFTVFVMRDSIKQNQLENLTKCSYCAVLSWLYSAMKMCFFSTRILVFKL